MIAVFTTPGDKSVYYDESLSDVKSLRECFDMSTEIVKLPKRPIGTYLQPAYYRELLVQLQNYILNSNYIWIDPLLIGSLEYNLLLGFIFAGGFEYGRVLIKDEEQQKLIHKFSGPNGSEDYIEEVIISKEEYQDSIKLSESIEFLRSHDVRKVVLKDLSIDDSEVQILLGYLYYSGINIDPGTLSGHELAKVIFGR